MRRHGQHPALGRQFVAELLAALAGDAFDQAAEVIGRWRGVTLYLPASGEEREQRVRAARVQLAAGATAADAARVIVARFGCSDRTAREAVAQGRRQLQEVPPLSPE